MTTIGVGIKPHKHRATIAVSQTGFTVPELIIVMVLTLLFSSLVLSFAFDFWGTATDLQNSSETLVTRQNIGDRLRGQLNVASTLLNQNSIADTNANVSDPSDVSGTAWLNMHAVPETVATPVAGQYAPILYYAAPALNASKNFIMRGVEPEQNEFVLYLDGAQKKLMLRTLANPASGNVARTSCPASVANASCPVDRTLADDVVSVGKKYFSKSGNTINWNDVIDPDTGASIGPDYPDVEVVELTITLRKRAVIHGRADSLSSTTVRVALRNG